MRNSEESRPQKKRKMEVSPSSSFSLSSLPNDIALKCIALTSRSDQAALSLTSKSSRSLVASSDLYKIRSSTNHAETYVYVCLRTYVDNWYILRRRKTLDGGSDLIPIPSLPSQPREASSVVVIDWEIYIIGGLIKGVPTCDVWLLDCRTHTWRIVPSMGMARANAAAGVVDGKIYVLGGFMTDDYSCWVEVFDPKTQTWETLPLQEEDIPLPGLIHDSVVWDQKLYAVDGRERTFYYSPSESKWGRGKSGHLVGNRRDWCMIDDLIYCVSSKGRIYWYEPNDLDWLEGEGEPEGMLSNEVKGLDSLRWRLSHSRLVHFDVHSVALWEQDRIKFDYSKGRTHTRLIDLLPGARLTNSGSNILLFWDVTVGLYGLEIWCAEISLKRLGVDVWGNIEWSNAVMTIDRPLTDRYKVLYSASVTL
ncbi:unnamed protein product [Arabidopsis halleri]